MVYSFYRACREIWAILQREKLRLGWKGLNYIKTVAGKRGTQDTIFKQEGTQVAEDGEILTDWKQRTWKNCSLAVKKPVKEVPVVMCDYKNFLQLEKTA